MADVEQTTSRADNAKAAKFLAGSSALLIASLTSGVLSFAWTVLMSRLLGPKGYGLAGPFMTAFWMLAMVLSLGIPQAMATFISDRHYENPAHAKLVMAQGTRLMFVIGAIFVIAAAAGVNAASAFLKIKPVFISLSWLMIAALIGRQLYFGMFAVISGVQRLGVLAICNSSYPVTMLICSVIFVIAAQHYFPGDVDKYLIAGAGGVAAASIMQYFISLIAVKFAKVSLSEIYAWRGAGGGARKLLFFGLPAAIASIAASLFS
ncbi:MAG: oligosaccharide flippase family protein, partial [bacterium]